MIAVPGKRSIYADLIFLLFEPLLRILADNMGKSFTVALAAFAATGSFLFGYDSGVMTDVIASPNFLAFFNTTQTSSIIGAINSTFSGGGKSSPFTAFNLPY